VAANDPGEIVRIHKTIRSDALLNNGETARLVDLLHILNLAKGETVGNKKSQAGHRKDFVQGHGLQKILMAASIICDAEVRSAGHCKRMSEIISGVASGGMKAHGRGSRSLSAP
jgi:hypothetical protein